ncbi:MAG: hypothetical protein COW27_05085 [Nitrosopumilales archaeon CG15_BIG_FIL_POST_REV_8_21_14_020_37_12]|nr:MAG: hypothetical protein COW27_05085 [Nitrosopumilales archaeon CG15_BIG_FIL_POST_REV_8_21_14_020_37_12]
MNTLTIFRFFSPIRIIEIITLLSLISIFRIEWQFATIIFQYFFPIIAGSVVFEAILDKEGFKKGLKKTVWKYYSGIGIQFVGITVFAISSFNSNPENMPMIIGYSLLIVAIGGCLEAFHWVSEKKLKNIKLSPLQEILSVIGFTIMVFFFGLYTVLELIPRTTWFG